jgi:5'-nucleotidase
MATNDVHGELAKLPVVAGFVGNLRRARARDGGVLLVDAGDAFQGTIESNLNEGAAIVSAYAAMGYAAVALGNHEFDFGPEGPASSPRGPGDDPQGALKRRLAEAPFPVLSANLVGDDGRMPTWRNLGRSTETVVHGVRVAMIGLLTENANEIVKRPNFIGLHAAPLAFAAAEEALLLRHGGADVVVLVAHAGGECERFGDPGDLASCDADSEIFRLARALPPKLIDVIVGGHRNAGVAHVVNGIPIIHAPSHLVAFSRIDLVFDPRTRRITEKHIEPPHPVCTRAIEDGCSPGSYEGAPVVADPAVTAAIRPALQAARALGDRPLGVTVEAAFPAHKSGETALGNLFADAMREAVPGADAAIGNAGSVRDTLPAGPLTFARLHHVMPFDNQLALLHVTGAELAALVSANLTEREHGLLSISGVTVQAACTAGALEVTLARPDGTRVRGDEDLAVATSDYIAFGGDGLLAAIRLSPQKVDFDTGKTVLDALVAGLEKRHALRPVDPALLDPKHPRMQLPGPWPVRCSAGR